MSLTPQQIEARRSGLGGSDAGSIVGVNPYRGPFDVWARFHLPHEEGPPSQAAHFGNVLEGVIADEYAARTGVELVVAEGTMRHPGHSWMLAHPDRLVRGRRKLIEIKTAGARQADRWGSDGEEEVPVEYRLQVAHYLAVLDYDEADLVVLIGGQDFRIYPIRRDLEIERSLIEAEKEFWERHVIGGEQPDAAASPDADAILKRLYPRNRLPEMEATAALVQLAREFDAARATADLADEAKKAAGARLKAAIGDAEGFRWGKKSKVTWTNNRDSASTDWEAVVHALNPPEHLIAAHTRSTPGPRVLRVTVKE